MIVYSASNGRPNEAAPQGTLARDRTGRLWEQTAPGVARHWQRFSVNGPASIVIWSSETVPITPSNVEDEVDYIRPLGDGGKTNLYVTSFVVRDPLLVHGLVVPLTTLTDTSQIRVKAAIFECLPGDRKTLWPWRLFHADAVFELDAEISETGPFFVPPVDLMAEPIFLASGRYYVLHIWDSNPEGIEQDIFGAKFAVRRARDIRGTGWDNHANNIFVGDRVARGETPDQLDNYRVYATINFSEIVIDGGSSTRIGSDPYKSGSVWPMASMDIGLQAEVYPN